jgi:hypothetical protein
MQRLKIFSSASCGDDLAQFERLVDDWLVAAQPLVQVMTQSPLGIHLVLSVLYVENDPDAPQASATEAVAVPDVFDRTLDDANLDPDDAPDSALPEVELPY